MRVLHLITDLGRGGAERFTLDLCRELAARPATEVVIGSLYPENSYARSSLGLRVENLGYKTYSLRRRHEVPAYARLLREFQPDVVHTHRFLAEFLSSLYVTPDRAYVCHCHDNMVQFARPSLTTLRSREGVLNYLERRVLFRRKYSRVRTTFVANSDDTLAFFRRALPARMREDVRIVPYGFSISRFRRPAAPTESVAEARPLRLVNVGSFQQKKNQALAILVAGELRRRLGAVRLDLIGDGATRPAVQELARRLDLDDCVHFRGDVDDVETWLWSSDVYLHTAWYEPFGLVFLEAMAAGLPVVALDGRGNRSLLRHEANSLVVEDQVPARFAAEILRLREDAEMRARIVQGGLATAEDYDIRKRADAFIDLYGELLRRNSRRPHSGIGPASSGMR